MPMLNFQRYNIANGPVEVAVQPSTGTFIAPAPASSTNPLVQGLINLFMNDTGQKRPVKKYNLILEKVAQARADDLCLKAYFAHTDPTGYAANYYVRKAGYPLAKYYGSANNSNQIESIAAGHDNANACWIAWLNSPLHERHVRGLTAFFAEQCDFGIGYRAGGQYGHYWVLISART